MKRRPAKVREKPLTYAQIRKAKEADRVRDWERLARGEVTPAQLQKENSAVPNAAEFEILNLRQVARYYSQRNRRRR